MQSSFQFILIVSGVRSAYNVGSLWRSAESVGAERIILTGISPRPPHEHDSRLPHVAQSAAKQIAKTALGAETSLPFDYYPTTAQAITALEKQDYQICALEQSPSALSLFDYKPRFPLALIVGHETEGLTAETMAASNCIIEIPQFGQKESLNVSVAGGIAMYIIRQNSDLKA